MKKSYQLGSAHVVIIIALVVMLMGTLGWIFWQNFIQKKDGRVSTADTTKTDTKQAANKTKQEEVTKDSNEGYVVLEDWGVRFKPTSTTKISWAKSGGSYAFTTDTWKNLTGACNTEIKVFRTPDKDNTPASPPIALNDEQKIGDYYYYYLQPHDACFKTGEGDSAAWSEQARSVTDFIKTIEQTQ